MGAEMNRVYMQLHNDKPTVHDAVTDEPIVSYPNTASGFEKCSTLVAEHNAEVAKQAKDPLVEAILDICLNPFLEK